MRCRTAAVLEPVRLVFLRRPMMRDPAGEMVLENGGKRQGRFLYTLNTRETLNRHNGLVFGLSAQAKRGGDWRCCMRKSLGEAAPLMRQDTVVGVLGGILGHGDAEGPAQFHALEDEVDTESIL